ncbi:UspA [Dillenia turbinata]|uniref:RING-type E3 ubiquitin transferase n=1 Tax=Dillenia turbinata TaxID=194707 RepID=A0AAN8W3T5_9MAGN
MANNGGGENVEKVAAAAIKQDIGSRHAVEWAMDHIVSKGQSLYLVHVKSPSPSLATSPSSSSRPAQDHEVDTQRQQYDASMAELYLSFRCFCMRRQVECEVIELEDTDVGRALIGFVHQYAVQTLLIGASSRNGLARIFKARDIASSVLRGAPGFCNVYVVSKGKLLSSRTASCPPPNVSASERAALANRNLNANAASPMPVGGYTNHMMYDELLEQDLDTSFESPGRPSTDSMLFSFYDNMGSDIMQQRSEIGKEFPVNSQEDSGTTTWSSQNLEEMEDKFRNLRGDQFEQTKEMFQEALKEASAATQNVKRISISSLKYFSP